MPALQRSNSPRGPRFYPDDGKLLFVNVLDSCTRDGPRLATEADRNAHPDAYAACEATMCAGVPILPLVSFEGDEPEGDRAAREATAAAREARRKAAA